MRGKSKPLQSKRRDEAMDVDDDQVRLVVVVIVVVVVMGCSVIVVRFKVVRGPVIVCVFYRSTSCTPSVRADSSSS